MRIIKAKLIMGLIFFSLTYAIGPTIVIEIRSESYDDCRRVRNNKSKLIGEGTGSKLYRKYITVTPEKPLEILVLKIGYKADLRIDIVVNEKLNSKCWIDWGNEVHIGDKTEPLDSSHEVFNDSKIRGDREELIEKFKEENPNKDIIAVLPNGNLVFNSWFTSYIKGKLFHNAKEPVFKRTYSSLVIWRDGHISIEDIKFEKVKGTQEIKVINANTLKDITEQVLYTTYGQRLVKNGDIVNPVNIYEQFDDLSHLFYFPLMPVDGREVIGGAIVAKMHRNRIMVKNALEGKAVSFELEEDLKGIAPEELRERLNQAGYREVESIQDVINPGDYIIEGDTLSIKLIRNQYRHFVAGVKDGKLVTISILGKSGSYGATIEEAAEIAKRQDLEDAILLCNGRDVWLQYKGNWIEDTGRRGISSVIIIARDKEE